MKKHIAMILTAALLMSAAPLAGFSALDLPKPALCGLFSFADAADVVASGECGADDGGLKWTLDSEGTLVITGTGPMRGFGLMGGPWLGAQVSVKKVVIEPGATSIGYNAFDSCTELTSVTIPDTVISINDDAFWECAKLVSVTVPDSVASIGRAAFYKCSGLTSVEIGKNVTKIGESAFSGCKKLGFITVDPENTVFLGRDNCLINIKDKKLLLGTANSIIPSDGSAVCIGKDAFSHRVGLSSLSIPDGVTEIEPSAFFGCDAESVTIPDSVTTIGFQAFQDCNGLKEVTVGNGVSDFGNDAFYGCDVLETVTIGNNEPYDGKNSIHIGDEAFYGCRNLRSVTLGDAVSGVGRDAFHGCANLTSLIIGNHVTEIEDDAFKACNGPLSITIGDGLTKLGGGLFEECCHIEALTVSEGNAVYYSKNNCIIEKQTKRLVMGCKNSVIPSDGSVTAIGFDAFQDCVELTEIEIPDSVTEIEGGAFDGCAGLKSVRIPEEQTRIGSFTFADCKSLASVYIPDSVTSIEISAFRNCAGLTAVILPDGLTRVEQNAFYGCTGLTSMTVPDGMTAIEWYFLPKCSSLRSVTIPVSVKGIWQYAFSECTALTDVYYTGTEEQWENVGMRDSAVMEANIHCNAAAGSFGDGQNKVVWTLDEDGCLIISGAGDMPDNTLAQNRSPWSGDPAVKTVVIRNGVTSICAGAFAGCAELTSVSVPKSVTRIGEDAFSAAPVVRGTESSCAEQFAQKNGNAFKPICEEEHVWGEGRITSFATCKAEGENTFTCIVCGETKTESIPAETIHWSDVPVRENVVAATCAKEGSYETVVYCSDCGEELQRTKQETPKRASHTPGGETVAETRAAACGAEGEKTFSVVCAVCGAILSSRTEPIPATGEHVWDDGVETIAPTLETEGEKTFTCTVCGATKTEPVEKLRPVEVTDPNTSVAVSYPPEAFDGEVELQVREEGDAAAVLTERYRSVRAYVVAAYAGGKEVRPAMPVTVRIPVPQGFDAASLAVFQTGDNGKEERLDISIESESVVFTVTGFGCFVVADTATKETFLLGDVDGNGKVESSDARLALRASVRLSNEPSDVTEGTVGYMAADYDQNGKVESSDARCILRAAVKLDPFA